MVHLTDMRDMMKHPLRRNLPSTLIFSFLVGVTLWMLLSGWFSWLAGQVEADEMVDEAQLQNVTDKTDVAYSTLKYNRRTGNMSVNLTVTNTSAESLPKPMYVVFRSITPGAVQLVQSDGNTALGKPYFDMSSRIAGDALEPGARTSPRVIELHNPSRDRLGSLAHQIHCAGIGPQGAPDLGRWKFLASRARSPVSRRSRRSHSD